jgi:hypothetical protein
MKGSIMLLTWLPKVLGLSQFWSVLDLAQIETAGLVDRFTEDPR